MLRPARPARRKYSSPMLDSGRWASFNPRAGDIVVCTPPKCGTTWTQAILALLISGDPLVDAQPAIKAPWIEFDLRDVDEVMGRLDAQDHRRQVKTHSPLDGIPVWDDLRYICVYRHPVDMYFSFRKHAINQVAIRNNGYFPDEFYSDDPREGFEVFLYGEEARGPFLRHMITHYLAALDHAGASNILLLHYADMRRDLAHTVRRIAAHVGISHSEQIMDRLVGAATFENMKANADRFTPSAGTGVWASDAGFFDSATSNKWEGTLAPSQMAAYATRLQELLADEHRGWLEWGNAAMGE